MDRQGVSHEPVTNPRVTQCAGGTQRKDPPNRHDSNPRASQSQRQHRVDSTQGQSVGGNGGGDQGGGPPNNPNHQPTAPPYAQRRGYCCTYCDRCKNHFAINGRHAVCSNGNLALEVRVGEAGHPCLGPPLSAHSMSSGQWECPHSCLVCENCVYFHRRWTGQEYVRALCSHDRYAVFVTPDHVEHSRVCPGFNRTGSASSAVQYTQNYPQTRPASSSSPPRRVEYPNQQMAPSSPEAQSSSPLDQRGWHYLRNRSSSACSQQQHQHQQPQRSPTMPQIGQGYVGSGSLQH